MEKLYEKCLRCGRKLKHEQWKRLGYGPVCYKKAHAYKIKTLFDCDTLSNNDNAYNTK